MSKKPATFASRLRRLRESSGKSPYRLAKDAGIDPSGYYRLESGESEPTLAVAVKLARALGCDLNTIGGFDERR